MASRMHLTEHVAFAKAQGVKEVVRPFNGDVVALEAGSARLVNHVTVGRRYTRRRHPAAGRRRMHRRAHAGFPSPASCRSRWRLSDKGDLVGDPDVMIAGLPQSTRDGAGFDAIIDAAIFETIESLPRAKRRDADFVSTAIERAVRNSVNAVWGKRPTVHVLIVEV